MAMITCINLLLLTGAPFFSAELHTDLASHSSVNKFNVDFCPHSLRVSTNSSLVNLPKKELSNESFDKDMNKETLCFFIFQVRSRPYDTKICPTGGFRRAEFEFDLRNV